MSRYGNECNIQTTSTSEKDDLQVKGKTSHVPSRESFKNKWVCMKYGTFLISGMSLAIFLQTTPAEWLPVLLPKYCPEAACTRTQAVYRISFSLFIFYLIHFLVANKYNRLLSVAARRFFVEWWMAWKIVPFGMLFAMSIFLPSSFFMWYGWFSLAASCMFLLLQVIVLIDFAYELSERWIRNAESAEDVRVSKAWLAAIVIVSLLLVVGSYSAYGVLLYLFACSVARGGLLVSFLLNTTGIVMSIASPHGNIFPSGVVAAYTLTLCFSALTSMVPREGCQLRNGGYGVLSSVYFNCFIAAISVTRASLSVAHARDAFTLKPSEVEKVDYTEDMSNEEQEDTEMISAYSFFFGVMMLASCYIAMLMTSWDLYSIQSNAKVHMMDKSDVAMWLKFSCSWLASLLYIWSLIAPYVLPHRF